MIDDFLEGAATIEQLNASQIKSPTPLGGFSDVGFALVTSAKGLRDASI
jgi:hypothetical protein